ncbi:hypothetical protein BSL78_25346 [Apostichopus japonicus]|uniref:Uncharacterized protein n=1 Tax=Stichopus japonicus TaxID=307972 RepID=A0A2G8JQ05_STIJA|nr:hypothetical protein BSL78_25346 [Apostichopus japonicus]
MTDLQKRRKRTACNRFKRPQTPPESEPPSSTAVVNLSSSTLTSADLRLLSKGLNFCPTPPSFDQAELSQDLTHFFRRIRLREFFLDDPPTEREPFCKKSSWMPPKNRVPVLEVYTQVVSSETNQSNSPLRRTHNNHLPNDERTTLCSLMSRSDNIIKPADKGSAVVIQDRQDYIKEAMRHLSNSDILTLLDSVSHSYFLQADKKQTITDMYQRNQISKKAVSFLSLTDCKAARFYLLPNIHKPGNPGRPIISGNGSPTEKISLFVDHFINPLVPQINSYIHDTPDFLRKLEDIKNQIPSTAIIGTFDVTSLYTNPSC